MFIHRLKNDKDALIEIVQKKEKEIFGLREEITGLKMEREERI